MMEAAPSFAADGVTSAFQRRWLQCCEVVAVLLEPEKFGIQHSSAAPDRPRSGQVFLYNKRDVPYFRRDGHEWRKKKNSQRVREDHEKLRIGGEEVLNCYYAHHVERPAFHRRVYWLLAQTHLALVHYLDLSAEEQIAPDVIRWPEEGMYDQQPPRNPHGSPLHSHPMNGYDQRAPASPQPDFDFLVEDLVAGSKGSRARASADPYHRSSPNRRGAPTRSPHVDPIDSLFSDIPDLAIGPMEDYGLIDQKPSLYSHNTNGTMQNSFGMHPTIPPPRDMRGAGAPQVLDFSPSWDYADGGAKILLTGSFLGGSYVARFGDTEVPCESLMPNVLRCRAPPHAAGVVRLCVSPLPHGPVCTPGCCVLAFEYRQSLQQQQGQPFWITLNELDFKMRMIDRVENLERSLRDGPSSPGQGIGGGGGGAAPMDQAVLSERLDAALCRIVVLLTENNEGESLPDNEARLRARRISASPDKCGFTLLHHAAACGLHNLIVPLIRAGASVLARDNNGRTPLHLAAMCGRGQCIAVLLLEASQKRNRTVGGPLPKEFLLAKDSVGLRAVNYAVEYAFATGQDVTRDSNVVFLRAAEDAPAFDEKSECCDTAGIVNSAIVLLQRRFRRRRSAAKTIQHVFRRHHERVNASRRIIAWYRQHRGHAPEGDDSACRECSPPVET